MRKSLALLVVIAFLTSPFAIIENPVNATFVQENTWISKAPMRQARSVLGVATVNDNIYAIGGSISSRYPLDSFVGTNEEYNVTTNTWKTKSSMPTARGYFAIASYQNKIYCFGGAIGMRLVDEIGGFYGYVGSNVTEVYDTVTDTWTTKAPMPIVAMQISAQQINGKIYIIGYSKIFVYDILNDYWTDIWSTTLLKCSIVLDNKIIVTGVHDVWYSPTSPYYGLTHPAQQVAIYDPENNNLTQGKDGEIGIDAASIGATIGIKAPPRVYVLGVIAQKSPDVPVNQVYDPKTDTWISATAMPTLRLDFGVGVLNDTLYAIGGLLITYSYDSTGKYVKSAYATPTSINEQYVPLGYETLHPQVSILSPKYENYTSSSISLDFYSDKPSSELSYSLDGAENVTIPGNSTITNLINGEHNLTIYVKDAYDNIGSQSVTFTMSKPERFPTIPVVAVSALIAVVVLEAGLLVYFKKHKRVKIL